MSQSFPPWLIWFVLGIAIALAELAIPSFVLIFFGIGCLGASLLAWIAPGAFAAQVAAFTLVTIISLVTLRRLAMRVFVGKSEAAPNEDLDENFTQAMITVEHDLSPGQQTRIRYRGSTWTAVALDTIPAGSQAEVTGQDPANKSLLRIKSVPFADKPTAP